jgi:hypothetical protein
MCLRSLEAFQGAEPCAEGMRHGDRLRPWLGPPTGQTVTRRMVACPPRTITAAIAAMMPVRPAAVRLVKKRPIPGQASVQAATRAAVSSTIT